jgi:hypothetical protein
MLSGPVFARKSRKNPQSSLISAAGSVVIYGFEMTAILASGLSAARERPVAMKTTPRKTILQRVNDRMIA